MSDSYFMGDIVGDIIGDVLGDDDMGDDDMGDEVGRVRRGQRRRMARVARKAGLVTMTPAQARELVQKGAEAKADRTGIPQSLANGKLATSGQRLEVLPLGTTSMAAIIGGTGVLSVNVQRAIQPFRLILQAADVVTGLDMLFSLGTGNIVLGAHNLFASPGVIAPASAFGRDAWGTEILSVPMVQGGVVRVDLTKLTATPNALAVSGLLFGYSAQS